MTSLISVLRPELRVAEREMRFFQKVWKGQSFTLFIAPPLFLIALGLGVGGMVEQPASLGGVEYLDFVTPGLLVGAVFQMASGSGLWPVMAGHRWLGFHRAMVASPVGPTAIAGGYLLWLFVRSAIQATVVLGVGAVLGGVESGWAFLAVPVAATTALAAAAPLSAYTATCDSDRAFDPIMRVVVTPLYLFSGVFFPSDALPIALAWFVRLFPLWHGVELARTATTGVAGEWSPLVNLAVILIWAGGGWLAARRTFRRRLTP